MERKKNYDEALLLYSSTTTSLTTAANMHKTTFYMISARDAVSLFRHGFYIAAI